MINFKPFYEMIVFKGMMNLINSKPYTSMLIQYKTADLRYYFDRICPGLYEKISEDNLNQFSKLTEYYMIKNDLLEVESYLTSYRMINRANPNAWRESAK